MPTETNYARRTMRTDFTTRTDSRSGNLILEGYFVVFNSTYYIGDWCEEVVDPRAFEGCDMSDVRALIDHLTHLVLGRTTANTLELSIDDRGLFARIRINPEDRDAMNLYARTMRGDVDQASFGFDEREVAYEDLENGRTKRTILKIAKLWEVSVCTFPAYEETNVSARGAGAESIRQEILQRQKEKLKRRIKDVTESKDP